MARTLSVNVLRKSDWQHQHFKRFKNFVKLKIMLNHVSNFEVLVVSLIFDHFLVRRDGKDWLHTHFVQRTG